MRTLLGSVPATNTSPELRVSRHWVSPKSQRIEGAIAAYLSKKNVLQETQQPGTSSETEADLREKVKSLEEQLALLLQKLEAGDAAPTGQPLHAEGVIHNVEAAAEATPNKSTSPRLTDLTGSDGEVAASRPVALSRVDVSTRSKDKHAPAPKVYPGLNGTVAIGSKATEALVREEQASISTDSPLAAGQGDSTASESSKKGKLETSTLAQQIQTQAKSMKSSSHVQLSRLAPQSPAAADQSLLDELFPEVSSQVQPEPLEKRPPPPKLDLPATGKDPRIHLTQSDSRSDREKAIDAFRARGEQTTVLQLSNCSTALTESDFRRLIPRGLHIESWSRDGEFYKIIPGRDPLSLARLPIYYLLFHSPASALAYQKNASRLSKLSALHATSGIHSAIMPPTGYLENGEDIHAVTSSFVLHPQGHQLDLRTVMQPYNRALRALIDAGGYAPIVANVDQNGKKIHRVLLHIDGYEPSHWDLWQIISRHAHARGILWPFRNEHAGALRRLRDCVNLRTNSKTKFQAVSMSNPRAANTDRIDYDDPQISFFLGLSAEEDDERSSQEVNQVVMNRVYNRWIVEFDDEDAARRFAGLWHRVLLPDAKDKKGAWKDAEAERWVEAEYLW